MTGYPDATRGPRVHGTSIGALDITTIVTGRWNENCYVVRSAGGDVIVVDPGAGVEDILGVIGGAATRAVLLTHGHYDHVGAADAICDRFSLPCHVAQDDVALVKQAPLYSLSFDGIRIRSPRSITAFAADEVQFGTFDVRIIPCPGHTPGSTAFLVEGALFTGDTILREHLGRTDLRGGDAEGLRRSVARLLDQVPDDAVILPGHGRPWTVTSAKALWSTA